MKRIAIFCDGTWETPDRSEDGKPAPTINDLFWAGLCGLVYLPATVAPAGLTAKGLPVGVQIIGPQYGDKSCIAFAGLLERAYRGFVPPPNFA